MFSALFIAPADSLFFPLSLSHVLFCELKFNLNQGKDEWSTGPSECTTNIHRVFFVVTSFSHCRSSIKVSSHIGSALKGTVTLLSLLAYLKRKLTNYSFREEYKMHRNRNWIFFLLNVRVYSLGIYLKVWLLSSECHTF